MYNAAIQRCGVAIGMRTWRTEFRLAMQEHLAMEMGLPMFMLIIRTHVHTEEQVWTNVEMLNDSDGFPLPDFNRL